MGREKLDRVQKHFRVDRNTPEKLNQIAIGLGFKYGKGGAIGELLDAIARGDIALMPQKKRLTNS
jgi:hypothetical protein